MRRLDYEVCRCHVGGDRNVPYRRQTQQGFHVRIVRHGILVDPREKINTSIFPSEDQCANLLVTPIGPLNIALTFMPVAREIKLPVVPVAYSTCCSSNG